MSTGKPSNDYDSGYYGKREDTDRESWIGGCDETFRFHGFVVVSPSIVALGEVRGGNDVRGEKKRGAYDGIFIPRRSRKQELSGVYGYDQQFRNNGEMKEKDMNDNLETKSPTIYQTIENCQVYNGPIR